jgi:chromate transporter
LQRLHSSLSFVANVPFPLIVLVAGIIGHFGGKYAPSKIRGRRRTPGGQNKPFGPALIDDDTPTLGTRASRVEAIRCRACGLHADGLAAIAALSLMYGWTGTLTQMAWFFTKAALLTFGGAYAVLPYVYQGAVDNYHWLTPDCR